MIGTTIGTASYVGSPTVELPAAEIIEKVNLQRVAYQRDNSSYEDLLKALLQRVSVLQKQLAAKTDR